MSRIIFSFLVFSLIIATSSCANVKYYAQAANGQLEILSKRESVSSLIKHTETDEKLRQQLILAMEIRAFAVQRLGLEKIKGFTQYADVKRRHVVWNVVAAPAYSLQPKTWCFPIAGCVAYKGFFIKSMADKETAQLRAEGYDVVQYGVSAYSTLGWFSDPLLNTFIHYPETDLAALIFHELAHQMLYVKDDSAFNEAFATAVEIKLLEDWLQIQGDQEKIDKVTEDRRRHYAITAMVLDYRERLGAAYLLPDHVALKPLLFTEMKSAYQKIQSAGEGTRYYDWWFSRELNNADLLSLATYYQLVPKFNRLLAEAEGDMQQFIKKIRTLAQIDIELRYLKMY